MATGVVPEDLLEVGTACREDDLVPLEGSIVKWYIRISSFYGQREYNGIIMIMVAITVITIVINMIS